MNKLPVGTRVRYIGPVYLPDSPRYNHPGTVIDARSGGSLTLVHFDGFTGGLKSFGEVDAWVEASREYPPGSCAICYGEEIDQL